MGGWYSKISYPLSRPNVPHCLWRDKRGLGQFWQDWFSNSHLPGTSLLGRQRPQVHFWQFNPLPPFSCFHSQLNCGYLNTFFLSLWKNKRLATTRWPCSYRWFCSGKDQSQLLEKIHDLVWPGLLRSERVQNYKWQGKYFCKFLTRQWSPCATDTVG